jgi:phage protein D
MELLDQSYVQPAECIIKVAGEEISDLYPYVGEVSVEVTRDRYAEATITFFSPVDETGYWLVADDPRLETWADIVISADFQTGTEEIMRGVILAIEPQFPTDAGEARLKITARDDSGRLDRGVRQKKWGKLPAGTTDYMILRTLADDASLLPDPDCGLGQSNLVLLQNDSNIAFLRSRAQENGYELIFSKGTIYFGPMRLSLASQPTIMVYAGLSTNCRSLSLRNDGHQRRKVAYAQRDDNGDPRSPTTVEADNLLLGNMPAQGEGNGLDEDMDVLDRASVPDDARSQASALGRANDGDMSLHADGELDGSLFGHVLRVAEPVEVDGIGDRHSGTYYVHRVIHRFDSNGYAQRFSLIRNALGRNSGGALSGALSLVL